jgi:HAD superfamily hydrolase (TIGR01549 family)
MKTRSFDPSTIDAVCFDCFGTLLSVIEGPYAYRGLVGQAPDRRGMRHAVLTLPHSFEQHAVAAGWAEADIASGRAALDKELATIAILDDAPRVLEELRQRGLKVALCSNLATEFGPPALKALGFQFDTTVLSYEVGLTKPDPAIFQLVCRNLACPPEHVLMIGDSRAMDVEGAQDAGLQAMQVSRGVTPVSAQVLSSLNEIAILLGN